MCSVWPLEAEVGRRARSISLQGKGLSLVGGAGSGQLATSGLKTVKG